MAGRRSGRGLSEESAIIYPNKKTTRWVVFLFGGLEGDRTLEPHGCEPCALPSVTVITDRLRGKQQRNETKKQRKERNEGYDFSLKTSANRDHAKACVVTHAHTARATSGRGDKHTRSPIGIRLAHPPPFKRYPNQGRFPIRENGPLFVVQTCAASVVAFPSSPPFFFILP